MFQTLFSLFLQTITFFSFTNSDFLLRASTTPILPASFLLEAYISCFIVTSESSLFNYYLHFSDPSSTISLSSLFIIHCSPFVILDMANIGDAPVNIIDILNNDDDYSTIGTVNPRIPNIGPLEVSQTITNLILFSNNSGSGDGFIEDGSESFSSHHVKSTNNSSEGDKGIKCGSPVVRGTDVGLFHYIRPSIDP